MNDLQQALTERFTYQDEIKDVAHNGCSGGVSGFIYNVELDEFFKRHEIFIEDLLEWHCIKPSDMVRDVDCWTFQEMRQFAVWFVVELHCQQVLEDQDQANNNN